MRPLPSQISIKLAIKVILCTFTKPVFTSRHPYAIRLTIFNTVKGISMMSLKAHVKFRNTQQPRPTRHT